MWIPIPFVGGLNYRALTSVQGYSMVKNDMHGKVRKVSNYGLLNDGTVDVNPISWVEYHYHDTPKYQGGQPWRKLNNQLNTLLGDVDPQDYRNSDIQPRILGQDHEFFTDMREGYDNSINGGIDANLDFVVFGVVPVPWPNFS